MGLKRITNVPADLVRRHEPAERLGPGLRSATTTGTAREHPGRGLVGSLLGGVGHNQYARDLRRHTAPAARTPNEGMTAKAGVPAPSSVPTPQQTLKARDYPRIDAIRETYRKLDKHLKLLPGTKPEQDLLIHQVFEGVPASQKKERAEILARALKAAQVAGMTTDQVLSHLASSHDIVESLGDIIDQSSDRTAMIIDPRVDDANSNAVLVTHEEKSEAPAPDHDPLKQDLTRISHIFNGSGANSAEEKWRLFFDFLGALIRESVPAGLLDLDASLSSNHTAFYLANDMIEWVSIAEQSGTSVLDISPEVVPVELHAEITEMLAFAQAGNFQALYDSLDKLFQENPRLKTVVTQVYRHLPRTGTRVLETTVYQSTADKAIALLDQLAKEGFLHVAVYNGRYVVAGQTGSATRARARDLFPNARFDLFNITGLQVLPIEDERKLRLDKKMKPIAPDIQIPMTGDAREAHWAAFSDRVRTALGSLYLEVPPDNITELNHFFASYWEGDFFQRYEAYGLNPIRLFLFQVVSTQLPKHKDQYINQAFRYVVERYGRERLEAILHDSAALIGELELEKKEWLKRLAKALNYLSIKITKWLEHNPVI